MIFIVVRFPVRPELSDEWPALIAEFTAATRAEPGNVFFDWSRSLDDPHLYVLVEGFRDSEAGSAHVNSAHFKASTEWLPGALSGAPEIIHVEIPGEGWSALAELQPPA
jgi:quinol monooxygenase YgiN